MKAGEFPVQNPTLFLPSEIKLLNEMKDTVDTSQTMEFLLAEILETPAFVAKRKELYDEADRAIVDSVVGMNAVPESVLSMNGATRGKKDFIEPHPNRTIKNLVRINQDDVKKKMGSGQRMTLLLMLASKSSKECVFLDEPEKYSHPSLLNGTAKAINDLVDRDKEVYVATHSPKLVSMLKIQLSDILVINDPTHAAKPIPFQEAVAEASALLNVGSMPNRFKRYYESSASLMEAIQKRHNRPFIEALFTKRVYLCEGANDELYVNEFLRQNGGFYDDYCVFKAWGKTNLVVFEKLFTKLGIEVTVMYDKDDESKSRHKEDNDALRSLSGECSLVEMDSNLELAVGYNGKKEDSLAFVDYLELTELKLI